MNMIHWLEHWLSNDNTKLMYVLVCILIANLLDFAIGWLNARFNPKIQFSSAEAIYGIARKMLMFMLMVFFIPVSLVVPSVYGQTALWILYCGYLASELNSIAGHLGLVNDNKPTSNLITNFIKNFFNASFGNSHKVTDTENKEVKK